MITRNQVTRILTENTPKGPKVTGVEARFAKPTSDWHSLTLD
jgi:hypothetical protein